MSSWKQLRKVALGALLTGMLGMLGALPAQAAPTLTFSPSPAAVAVGQPVSIDVVITGVADLYAFQFSVHFDSTILQLVGSPTEGALLPSGGTTFLTAERLLPA